MQRIAKAPTHDRFFYGALVMNPKNHGAMTVLAAGHIKAALQALTCTSSLYPILSFLQCKEDCRDALDLCRTMPVDAVVLEAGGSGDVLGIDLAKEIKQLDEDINIIFVSDKTQHVWPAFDTDAIGYLTRPLNMARVEKVLMRAREHDTHLFQYALFNMEKACAARGDECYVQLIDSVSSRSTRCAQHARALLHAAKENRLYEVYDTEIIVQAICNHDIGKQQFYPLLRKSHLSKRERYALMQHTNLGYQYWNEIATKSPQAQQRACTLNAAASLTHHECWNGSGYPQGLRGKQIPLIGRLCAVCIAYETMITDYGYAPQQAKAVIRQEGGNLFDPTLAQLFADMG